MKTPHLIKSCLLSSLSYILILNSLLAQTVEVESMQQPTRTEAVVLGSAQFHPENDASTWFKWTSDHIIEGFDTDTFMVFGLKPSVENQKQAFKDSWEDTQKIVTEVKKEYTAEGSLTNDVKDFTLSDLKFNKHSQFNKEHFKNVVQLPNASLVAQQIPNLVHYVGDLLEIPVTQNQTDGQKVKKLLKGVWLITEAGAFLVLGVPSLLTISTLVASFELAWNILERSFVLTLQALMSVWDTVRFPLRVLAVPLAVLKSLAYQATMLGILGVIWTWRTATGLALVAVQVAYMTTVGIIGVSAALGAATFKTLKNIFYTSPKKFLGWKQYEYYVTPQFAAHWMQQNVCAHDNLLNSPADQNEMALYQEHLVSILNSPKTGAGAVTLSEQTRVIQTLAILQALNGRLVPQNAMINNGFYLGAELPLNKKDTWKKIAAASAPLYLYEASTQQSHRLGVLSLEWDQHQIKVVLETDMARIKKLLQKLGSFKDESTIKQLWFQTLSQFEKEEPGSSVSSNTWQPASFNEILNKWRKSQQVNPKNELSFPYTGFADVCMWANAAKGL